MIKTYYYGFHISCLQHWNIRIWDLFRASCLGFRILYLASSFRIVVLSAWCLVVSSTE